LHAQNARKFKSCGRHPPAGRCPNHNSHQQKSKTNMAQPSEAKVLPMEGFGVETNSAEESMEVDDDFINAGDDLAVEDLEEGEIDEPAEELPSPAIVDPRAKVRFLRSDWESNHEIITLNFLQDPRRVYENFFKGGIDLASEEGKLLLEKRAQRFSLTQGERKQPPVIVESIDESDLNTLYARYFIKTCRLSRS
jgi:hypothetical protein